MMFGPKARMRAACVAFVTLLCACAQPPQALAGAVGSPGGNAIPACVGKTRVATLAWNLSLQQAIDLPDLVARGEEFVHP